jgi:hypothetical protein
MKIIDKQTIKIALVVIGILASVAVYQFDKKGQEDIRAARQGAGASPTKSRLCRPVARQHDNDE